MLGDISGLEKIYIVCGYTDYPRRIIENTAINYDNRNLLE